MEEEPPGSNIVGDLENCDDANTGLLSTPAGKYKNMELASHGTLPVDPVEEHSARQESMKMTKAPLTLTTSPMRKEDSQMDLDGPTTLQDLTRDNSPPTTTEETDRQEANNTDLVMRASDDALYTKEYTSEDLPWLVTSFGSLGEIWTQTSGESFDVAVTEEKSITGAAKKLPQGISNLDLRNMRGSEGKLMSYFGFNDVKVWRSWVILKGMSPI
jgi:hypothetical protein